MSITLAEPGAAKRLFTASVSSLQSERIISAEVALACRGYLSNLDRYESYGAEVWLKWQDDGPVSLNATRIGASKTPNAWGRYANWYLAFTLPLWQRRGHAAELQRKVESVAVERGALRVKSLIQSFGGLRLHLALGHQIWALNPAGELVVDTPLSGVTKSFPPGVPIKARKHAGDRWAPMGLEELQRIAFDPAGIFRVDPTEEAFGAFRRRAAGVPS